MMNRRTFLQTSAAAALAPALAPRRAMAAKKPNLLFVFSDQWRAQAFGVAGDTNVATPHFDALAQESIWFQNATATCPVCSPYRATLLSGRNPDKHGVFINDVHLPDELPSIGDCLRDAGYHTGWIGKWHVNGRGRLKFIPREERQGFEYWRTMECTHDYNHSLYYADAPDQLLWEGYDAFAQTHDAARFIREHDEDRPFALFLSWGPPHNPFETAPESYKAKYKAENIQLRPNVPAEMAGQMREDHVGYYAHCTALDDCLAELLKALRDRGIEENTIVVVTSDHGEMLGSQGMQRKQKPWDESIRVPFLLRYPERFGRKAQQIQAPLGTADLMPTLLDLCGAHTPDGLHGENLVPWMEGKAPEDRAALIACYSPFGEWTRKSGGKEFRGIRTQRHTYVRDLQGPWLLYDNETDPYQQQNLAGVEGHADLQTQLNDQLESVLKTANDEFLPGDEYIKRFGHSVDENGTASSKA